MTPEMNEEEFVRWSRKADERKLGEIGERVLGNVFRLCGLDFVDLCHLDQGRGIGPRQQGNNCRILPDFRVNGYRIDAYVDSKAKRTAGLFLKMGNQRTQAIDRLAWKDYQAISEQHGIPCFLVVFELFTDASLKQWSGAFLLKSLRGLGRPWDGEGKMGDAVFWPRSLFVHIATLEPGEMLSIGRGKMVECRFKGKLLSALRWG